VNQNIISAGGKSILKGKEKIIYGQILKKERLKKEKK